MSVRKTFQGFLIPCAISEICSVTVLWDKPTPWKLFHFAWSSELFTHYPSEWGVSFPAISSLNTKIPCVTLSLSAWSHGSCLLGTKLMKCIYYKISRCIFIIKWNRFSNLKSHWYKASFINVLLIPSPLSYWFFTLSSQETKDISAPLWAK